MKLIARIATELGPRTTVQQGLSKTEASVLARAIEAQGGAAHILDDGRVLSLAARMHKRKRDKARRRRKTRADDMTNVPVPKRGGRRKMSHGAGKYL